jgi:hypothetical protein
MSKKLAPIDRISDDAGMRLGVVGLLIALFGAVLAFWVLPSTGYWIALCGILVGLFGMVLHFIKHWRSVFLVGRPEKNDGEDR